MEEEEEEEEEETEEEVKVEEVEEEEVKVGLGEEVVVEEEEEEVEGGVFPLIIRRSFAVHCVQQRVNSSPFFSAGAGSKSNTDKQPRWRGGGRCGEGREVWKGFGEEKNNSCNRSTE